MKTKIVITGQIAGNFKLKTAILSSGLETKVENFFSDFHIFFACKRDAENALRTANKRFKSDDRDFYQEGGIKYFPKSRLFYDASSARIKPVASPDK